LFWLGRAEKFVIILPPRRKKNLWVGGEVSMVEILDEIKALTQKGDKNAKIAFIADMMNLIFIFAGMGCVFFMVGRSLDG